MVESKNLKIEKAPEIKPGSQEIYRVPEITGAEKSSGESVESSVLPEISQKEGEVPLGSAPIAISAATAYRQVENILEDGLTDVYFTLPPAKQKKFKDQGEKTAQAITKIIGRSKIKVQKIISLIISWLKIIPGVNRFFLEQEAKIKTDRILEALTDDREKIIR